MSFDLAGREFDLKTIAAQLACERLLVLYYDTVDAGSAASTAELFVEDGELSVGEMKIAGRAQLRKFLGGLDAIPGRKVKHVTTNFRFELVSDDEAKAHSSLTRYGIVLPDGKGGLVPSTLNNCLTEFRRDENKRWRLVSHRVTVVGGNA